MNSQDSEELGEESGLLIFMREGRSPDGEEIGHLGIGGDCSRHIGRIGQVLQLRGMFQTGKQDVESTA